MIKIECDENCCFLFFVFSDGERASFCLDPAKLNMPFWDVIRTINKITRKSIESRNAEIWASLNKSPEAPEAKRRNRRRDAAYRCQRGRESE